MQTPPDYLTKFLAAWGALLATFGLGWTLYRDLLDRAKLQVSAKVRRIAVGLDGKFFAVSPNLRVQATEKLFVVMSVVNVGRRPVMWQGWGGKYHKREAEGTAFFIVGQNLPKMLQEGESHSELTELGADLKPASDDVRRLYVWDPSGRQWALSRKQLRQLKKEAREATRSKGPAMNDTWTKQLGYGRGTVTYTTTGEVGTGFVHTSKYERRSIVETTTSEGNRQLTREEVEKLFEDFVSGCVKRKG